MSATIVETRYGQVKGEQIEGVYVWKGIPYASPPVGSLRFRPPEPPEAWEGIWEATEFGPAAPQTSRQIMAFLGDDPEHTSEDCLYLNVWSPGADNKKRPVMVWIHGGSFTNGSGSGDGYDGISFASLGDVVVVTINYRLGILGFLHLDDVDGEKYASSGNCGLLDQVAALKWIQDNIEAFGGDPNRVTIFGESAGAMSIGVLMAMPSAQGLFNQAILQSGAASNVLTRTTATQMANIVLNAVEVASDDLAKLEQMPVDQLLEAASDLPALGLGPVIDGVTLPESPEEALSSGIAKDIPSMIGTNLDEFRLFTFFDSSWKTLSEEELTLRFEKVFGALWPKLSDHFIENNHETLSQSLFDRLMTFKMFTFPAIQLAETQVKQGATVWMYRFDWQSPVFNGELKAFHASELPFVWHNINKPKAGNITGESSTRYEMANQMHQAWISFAHSGNPNTQEIPVWPGYDTNDRSTMLFNVESRIEKDPNREERVVWEGNPED
ncbi:carboxylesterase/lipase family protein [Tuberibacillus sp. Marseille-P3662]|uniref:carboxylesterase/lipase family protein n=1 Tax=Tuberibacillus sp. Marseille-P3662 TaxID=1965358 RepID=UPI000A1CA0E4|nr:carboxylesterase/lipase family protein [Tuberibacillus sp. Marseille-P3662]